MSEHDGHNVAEVNELFLQHKEDIKNLQNIVSNKLLMLKKRAADMEKLRSLNLQSCQQAELAIKDKAQEMIASIRHQERDMLDRLKTVRDSKLHSIGEEMESANFLIAKGSSVQDFADMTTRKNSLRLMALHEDLVQRMHTVAELDVGNFDQNVMSVIQFLPGREPAALGRIESLQGPVEDLSKNQRVITAQQQLSASSACPAQGSPMRRAFSEAGPDRNQPVAVLPNASSSYPMQRNRRSKPKMLFNINKVKLPSFIYQVKMLLLYKNSVN